jgi:hypothetical protein
MGSQTNEYPLSDSNEAAAPTRMIRDSGASFLLEMPVEEWIAMPGHPRQRDTDRHSKKSHWKRVRKLTGAAAEAQRQVIAAELDGKLIKVDGHTRAHLWSTGYLKRPDTVLVNVYRCSSLTELIRLYSIFDSQDAVEKQQDRVSGAMRQYHVKLTSKRLFQGAFTDSLSIAWRGIARGKDAFGQDYDDFDVYQAVRLFKKQLEALDSVEPDGVVFHTGPIAAALIDLTLHEDALPFYARLSKRHSTLKDQPPFDPVEGVRWMMHNTKASGRARDKVTQEGLCARVLLASDIYRSGSEDPRYYSDGTFSDAPDLLDAVRQVRAIKEREASSS